MLFAVSQAAPIRRLIVEGSLWVSQYKGFSSGGFMGQTEVQGDFVGFTQHNICPTIA